MGKITASLAGGHKYKVEAQASGHTLVSDQPLSVGGNSSGPNPKEYLQIAIAACTIQTLMMVKDQRKWDIQELKVDVSIVEVVDPTDSTVKIPQIDVAISVKGNLTQSELQSIERTAGKCPVIKLVQDKKLVAKSVTKI